MTSNFLITSEISFRKVNKFDEKKKNLVNPEIHHVHLKQHMSMNREYYKMKNHNG